MRVAAPICPFSVPKMISRIIRPSFPL
ncbi:MAG: hypothetical protein ACK4Z4_00395 [Ferrovibrio sp.]